MTIDWPYLCAATALLLAPITLFHGPKVRYRPVARDWIRHWVQVLTLGAHTIDLGRAILGAWLLAVALVPDPLVRGSTRHMPLVIQAAILGTAVLVQTIVCKERDAFHAPFAFVTGIVAGFLWSTPIVPGFAILFALVLTAGARAPSMYFPFLGASAVAAGALFERSLLVPVVVVGAVSILPPLLSIMFRRALVLSYRAKRSGESRPPHASSPAS